VSSIAKLRRLHRSGMICMAIRGAIGVQVSKVGDAVGSTALIYNGWTFDMFYRLAVETAPAIVACILDHYPETQRVVDFGAGTGAHAAEFRRRGIDCQAYEYAEKARRIGWKRLGVKVHPFDLSEAEPWDGERYHLAMSLEVAEHLPPVLGERLVECCVKSAPRVLFSAAPPGQGGQGHVNEQPKEYWIKRFSLHGYHLNSQATETFADHLRHDLIRGMHIARNVMIFEG